MKIFEAQSKLEELRSLLTALLSSPDNGLRLTSRLSADNNFRSKLTTSIQNIDDQINQLKDKPDNTAYLSSADTHQIIEKLNAIEFEYSKKIDSNFELVSSAIAPTRASFIAYREVLLPVIEAPLYRPGFTS